MRLLADMHISPRTVLFVRELGHDVVRVDEVLEPGAADSAIVAFAASSDRVVLTQDLDFSALVALGGNNRPSIISLRLASSRVDAVNERLAKVLPEVESATSHGAIVTVEDARVRRRDLPIN